MMESRRPPSAASPPGSARPGVTVAPAELASRLAAAVSELAGARTDTDGHAEPAAPAGAPASTMHWPLHRPGLSAPATGSPGRPSVSGSDTFAPTAPVSADGKPLRAVALRYDPFSGPPRVVASGRGHVAEALLARAREAGVPIEAQPDLVEVLMTLRIDQVIPPALYVAVAQVLAWAYLVDERAGRQRPGIEPTRR